MESDMSAMPSNMGSQGMDPATITAAMSVLGPLIQAFSGNKGGSGSTYSGTQKQGIEGLWDIINQIKGGASDITQNPTYQGGNQWLQDLFNDPEFFKSFEAPLQRQFQEETIPDLANRFAGMGSGGSLGSTGFRNQLAREGSNLHTNIAALRGGMQQQGANQALNYSQAPFNNLMSLINPALTPTKNTYQQSSFF
jgi:hypothetical protein